MKKRPEGGDAFAAAAGGKEEEERKSSHDRQKDISALSIKRKKRFLSRERRRGAHALDLGGGGPI